MVATPKGYKLIKGEIAYCFRKNYLGGACLAEQARLANAVAHRATYPFNYGSILLSCVFGIEQASWLV